MNEEQCDLECQEACQLKDAFISNSEKTDSLYQCEQLCKADCIKAIYNGGYCSG